MSDYLYTYLQRINASGETIGKSQLNSTVGFVNSAFADSPFYTIVKVNEVDTEVRIVDSKVIQRGNNLEPFQFSTKYLQFRPFTVVNIGDTVDFHSQKWLIADFQVNDIYPQATIKLCNSTFPIVSNKTRVLLGNNPKTGEPIYDWQDGLTVNSPCIVETTPSGIDNSQLPLPNGQMVISMKYQVADNLKSNAEFLMYGNKYQISDIDYTKVINDKGIMKIIAKREV